MSMTREEAITQLDLLLEYCESMMTSEYPVWRRDCEALQMLIAALRPISREQVENLWRGEWIGVPNMGVYDTACSKCGYCPGIRFWDSDFCPNCGASMTDEAVDMVMEKINNMEEMTNEH